MWLELLRFLLAELFLIAAFLLIVHCAISIREDAVAEKKSEYRLERRHAARVKKQQELAEEEMVRRKQRNIEDQTKLIERRLVWKRR